MPSTLYCHNTNCRITSFQGEFYAPYQNCPGCQTMSGGSGVGVSGASVVTSTYYTPAGLLSYSKITGVDEALVDELGQVLGDLSRELNAVQLSYPVSSDGWKLVGDIINWLKGKTPTV